MHLVLLGWIPIFGGAVWCYFEPERASWVFVSLFVFAMGGWFFFLSLARGYPDVSEDQPPHFFTASEAELIRRHKVYFSFPGTARSFSSILAAVGLVSWVLIPWLAYKAQWVQAGILFVNMFLAGPLSHKLSPVNGLRMLASKGNDEAKELLEAHDPAWDKIFEVRKQRRAELAKMREERQ